MRTLKLLTIGALACAALLNAQSIPAGTQVRIRLGQTITSASNKSGDSWTGTLDSDVRVDGQTLARKGDPVEGKVVDSKASGRVAGTSLLELQLSSVNGVPVVTESVGTKGDSHGGRNAKAAGGTAVLGAIIGGIAGGGKGAAIGAGAGAAAGTAGAAATGKKDVRYPVESVLTFTIR